MQSLSKAGQSPDTSNSSWRTLQTQLTSLRARYTDDYPDVIKTKADIAAIEKKIAAANASKPEQDEPSDKGAETLSGALADHAIASANSRLRSNDCRENKEQDQIKQQIKTYQDRIQSSPAVEQQYKELTRGYQTALDSYNELQKKRDDSAMATDLERKQQGEQFRVLDPANLPDKPSFPNRPLFAGGGLAGGLALGIGLALLIEMQNTSMRTRAGRRICSCGFPCLRLFPRSIRLRARRAVRVPKLPPAEPSVSHGARA